MLIIFGVSVVLYLLIKTREVRVKFDAIVFLIFVCIDIIYDVIMTSL